MKPKVLVIAEAANPEWVSVPLVGWSLARALSQVADTHLVTQIRNRDAILRTGLKEEQDFTAIDSEAVARTAYRVANVVRMGKGRGWTTTTAIASLAYPYFERLVWQRFGASIRAGEWDLVHRVTPLSPTAASPIAAKIAAAGVPFILGPLNGGVPWPAAFDAERRSEREWLSYLRGVYKLNPYRRQTLKSARAILVGSRFTQSEVPEAFQDKCVYIPENAIDPKRFPTPGQRDLSEPLRGLFVGRLVPYKGPDMAISAAAPLLREGRMVLDIVGDGPMMEDLKALALREGVQDAVTFHGNQPHEAVAAAMARAHLLVFPSIREFGGGVVLEAMASGVVPLVVDYAGPGELVSEGLGLKVPLGNRPEIVARFTAVLEEISADPTSLEALAQAAHKHARTHFTWEAKARQVADVYDWVLQRRPDRPCAF